MLNVDFVGRLGADCEEKMSAKGNPFLSMRVATDDFKSSTTERTTVWVRVLYPGERAIRIKEFLTKGRLVQVRGILRASVFVDRNNEHQVSLDVTADRIDFVPTSASREGQEGTAAATPKETPKARVTHTVAEKEVVVTETPPPTPKVEVNISDDDLPF